MRIFSGPLYRLTRQALFALPPELAHEFALNSLKASYRVGISKLFEKRYQAPVEAMGLTFPNPVGLAAGLDKNGDYIDALGALGFGFIEVGTVTPKAQSGNPKPRMFRLPKAQALINRLGFNNKGVDYLVRRVKQRRYRGILGINIGKNKHTPNAQAAQDYLYCLNAVYPYADYVTVNISSPNTAGLRDLQHGDSLADLLSQLSLAREQLIEQHQRVVPIMLKIAPDMDQQAIPALVDNVLEYDFDGIIATNTTITRPGLDGQAAADESGGLSGAPLFDLANQTLLAVRSQLPTSKSLIGLGGIMTGADAKTKFQCGADLVQIYTGFIYSGPGLIGGCINAAD